MSIAMTIDQVQFKEFDFASIMELLDMTEADSDKSLLVEYLELLIETNIGYLNDLNQSYAAGKILETGIFAHTLKPSFQQIKAHALYQVSFDIERMCKENESLNLLPKKIETLNLGTKVLNESLLLAIKALKA